MFSQEQSVSLKRPARPIAQSSIPAILTDVPSSLILSPFLPLSLTLSARPQVPFFLTSTPPLSRALHSSSSCHTLIHPPRAVTKQSLVVSPPRQEPATATLLFLSTTSCHSLIHPSRALTKHSLPVSPSHQAQATPTLLFLSTPPPPPSSIPLVSLTKQPSAVPPSHQAPATATLLFLSTPPPSRFTRPRSTRPVSSPLIFS